MKKTLIIIVHPKLNTGSVINRAWRDAVADQPSVTLHDLYATYSDGEIDVKAEQALLERHDRVIFQFPLWWYGAPALLKQWMDEVFTDGWAYGVGGDKMEHLEIGAAVSCGGTKSDFNEGGTQRHTLAHYLDVFDGVAAFTRAHYIGFHAVYDTYNPATMLNIAENCRAYVSFISRNRRES